MMVAKLNKVSLSELVMQLEGNLSKLMPHTRSCSW